jgi:serine protease Do
MIKKIFVLLVCVLCTTLTINANTLSKEVVEKVKSATVFMMMSSDNNITITNPNGGGLCSGFVINEKRHIVTNYHCVHNTTKLQLAFYDKDDWNIYEVKIIGIDPVSDLAVIQIPKRKKPLPFLNWSTEDPWDGQDVFAVGHPFGMVWSVSKGIISNTDRNVRSPYVRFIQTDVAINQGNSGGPLVNTAGNVVGVNSMIINPSPVKPKTHIGMALSVRVDDAKEIIEVLQEGKEFVRPIVGVQIADLTPLNRDTIAKMPEVVESGVTIPNTFGALIAPSNDIPEGLEQFDVIISADGQAVNRQTELTDHVRNKKVGDTIELVIIRDRIFKNVTVTLKKLEVEARTLYDKKGNITPPGTKPKEKPKATDNESKPEELDKDK